MRKSMRTPRTHHYTVSSARVAVIAQAATPGERIRAYGNLLNEAYAATGARPEDAVVVWDEHEREVGSAAGCGGIE